MSAFTVNTWKFEIGATITHRDQPFPAIVTQRVRTTKGREVYGVRRLDECEVRDLLIEGEALVAA